MRIWQADFYRRHSQDESGVLWELLICDSGLRYEATCPQSQVSSAWVAAQIQQADRGKLPNVIEIFRPQSLGLITQAGASLGIKIEATRRTKVLKQWLQQKQYSIAVDKPPPAPLPENLWGEKWRFATLQASDITEAVALRPIPIMQMPDFLLPIHLRLASTTPIPGVIIYGGRQSMPLARWLDAVKPVALNYIAGDPNGLVLEAGLADRWIVATFEDEEVSTSAKIYLEGKAKSNGLHFLQVQPDDSGMTDTGFWLLQEVDY